jgi:Flp pilus assembly protein TadG
MIEMRRWQEEDGTFTVLVAIMLVMFVAVLAGTIDLGVLRDERSAVQNGADNAALSAAYAYCHTLVSPGKTHSDAVAAGLTAGRRIAAENGYPLAQVTITSPVQGVDHAWRVKIDTSVAAYFASEEATGGDGRLETWAQATAACNPGITNSPPLPALWAGGTCGDKSILLNGSNTVVNGNIHSNDWIQVGGSNIKVNGLGTYVTDIKDNLPAKITWNPSADNPKKVAAQSNPTGFPYIYTDFQPGGSYYEAGDNRTHIFPFPPPSSQVSDGRLKPGIYIRTGEIDLSTYNGGDNVTLISQGGSLIKFPAGNVTYTPFLNGYLAISYQTTDCGGFAIDISGQNTKLDGILYAPNGGIKWGGSGTVLGDSRTGPLIAKHLTIAGQNDVIKGADGSTSANPSVTLAE